MESAITDKSKKPEPIVIRKLDKIETTHTAPHQG
jgi:hypothetical protein